MYPTKSLFDYMNERNRLFSNTSENDIFQSPTPPNPGFPSPFNQTTINRSSSSAESTSPESFSDFSSHRQFEPLETPCVVRRQRPIIGRKILDTTPPTLEGRSKLEIGPQHTTWRSDEQLFFPTTPPIGNVFEEHKNHNRNVLYELFPKENRRIESSTLIKANMSPQSAMSINYSLKQFDLSPSTTKFGTQILESPYFSSPQTATSSKHNVGTKMCTFCRKNGETPLVYMTHVVKERIGNRNIVTCPILRSHVCSTCGVSGDYAHTITYCPVLRTNNNGQPLQSTTITLKNTRVKSNGRRRY